MGAQVTGFKFTGPGRAKYPWEEWTNGEQWLITKGVDYEIPTSNMQISLHLRAKQENEKDTYEGTVRVATQTVRKGDMVDGFENVAEGLVFQFYTEDEE